MLLLGCGERMREVRAAYASGAAKSSRVEVQEANGEWVAHGAFREWSETGETLVEGGFAMGAQDGHWVQRHENGRLGSEGDFRAGKREGPWVFCDTSGTVLAEGSFRDDRKDGPWIYRHPNGKGQAKGSYLAGLREGVWIEWDENGAIDAEKSGLYESDVRLESWPAAGKRTTWYDEAKGSKKSEEEVQDGVRNGPAASWYPSGARESQGQFVLGQMDGVWQYWREDGSLDLEKSGVYERFVKIGALEVTLDGAVR
jgi:antitoxin component YwqK of YwqJK toxin-antitoxin module